MQKLLNYDEHVFCSTVAQLANNLTYGLLETPPISHNLLGIYLGSSTVK
jgi:hypothetical protein